MKLNITNPDAPSFTESVGITDERSKELSVKLDEYMNKLKTSGERVQASALMNEIAGMCETVEEYTFCIITHCNFMALTMGIFYCLPANFKELYAKKS